MSSTLHYLYDPLCGWCYGAEPLVNAAATVDGLEIELHAGCLWPQPTQLPEETRRYIQQADGRIASTSGQPFGEAYLSGLLLDPALVLESRPTIAAVLAAQALDPAKTLSMLRGIQHAHYEHGRHVVQTDELLEIAVKCGFDKDVFAAALSSAAVDAHIAEARRLMTQVGSSGFPTFVLETDGHWLSVPHAQFASDPEGFRQWLGAQLESESKTQAAS